MTTTKRHAIVATIEKKLSELKKMHGSIEYIKFIHRSNNLLKIVVKMYPCDIEKLLSVYVYIQDGKIEINTMIYSAYYGNHETTVQFNFLDNWIQYIITTIESHSTTL